MSISERLPHHASSAERNYVEEMDKSLEKKDGKQLTPINDIHEALQEMYGLTDVEAAHIFEEIHQPLFDHLEAFRLDDGRIMIRSHSYNFTMDDLLKHIKFLDRPDILVTFSTWSRWYPGQTIRIQIVKRKPDDS